ncbi:unnamed protein product, partial [Effrenium voratum]
KCPGCNVPVAPGYIFKNCNMCRVSVCEGCFLPLTSTCAKCNAIMNRTGALPASVFGPTAGQMGRTGLPTEASRCRDITLDPEPTAPTLSRWLTALKEAARNAFTYDCTCALSWVRSAEDAKSLDDLDVLCDYPALDARLSSALRACTQSPALKSRIDKLTAESHKNPRLGFPSTKIIWCIIDHHRASVQGQETVLIGELFGMKMPAITQGGGESQLEKFLNSWEVVEAQIQVPIDEQLKLHIFFQQVTFCRKESEKSGCSWNSSSAISTRGYGYGPKAVAWRDVQIRPAREQKS